MGVRPGTEVPVLPGLAQRLVDTAAPPDARGCRRSDRTPSRDRAFVEIPGRRAVAATRVIAAATLGRPILAGEDVHHTCHVGRCLQPTHLVVETVAAHSELHAGEQRSDVCPTHLTPWDSINDRGWGVCKACGRERTARWRENNPQRPARTDEQRERRNAAERARRATPDGRAAAAAKMRRRRARRRAERETEP